MSETRLSKFYEGAGLVVRAFQMVNYKKKKGQK